MESKTKHRILGILVVAGLIVIALPFMQHSKELTPETAITSEPPFPDQSVQVTTQTNDLKQQPDEAIESKSNQTGPAIEPPPIIANPPALAVPPTDKTPALDESDTAPASLDVQKSSKISALMPKQEATPAIPMIEEPTNKAIEETPTKTASVKTTTVSSKKNTLAKLKRHLAVHMPIDNNGLIKLHNAAWIVQVGSYKTKANALRIVNRLRANGYSAFIQQVSSGTQVFVGPEEKQTTARTLAAELEHDMHLHNMAVISYKPMA